MPQYYLKPAEGIIKLEEYIKVCSLLSEIAQVLHPSELKVSLANISYLT